MSFIGAAAVVGGGLSLASGIIGANAAEDAAQTQADAAKNAQQISLQEFNTITQQEQPFVQSGYGALSNLDWLLGIAPQTSTGATAGTSLPSPGIAPYSAVPGTTTPYGSYGGSFGLPTSSAPGGAPGYDPSSGYSIGPGGSISRMIAGGSTPGISGAPVNSAVMAGGTAPATGAPVGSSAGGFGSLLTPFDVNTFHQYSPAYQFQQQQGLQGVLNQDASGQGALSGATLKDLIGYNQNLANTSFNNAFNQYQTQQGNIFSRLSGIAQLGQSAAANTGQQGTALAGQAAQSATNIGTAQAAGTIGAANATTGALNSALPWLMYAGGG